MKYPACVNESCTHNEKFLCKADAFDEDIICKEGKAEAQKKINKKHLYLKAGQ